MLFTTKYIPLLYTEFKLVSEEDIMNILNIEAVQVKSSFCLLSCIARFAESVNRRYEGMYSGCWGFDIKGDLNFIENNELPSLYFPFYESPLHILKNHHSIQIIEYMPNNSFEALEVIEEELSLGLPVIIYIDLYYCAWSDFHKKKHADHFVLAIGIENNKDLICLDPFMSNSRYVLSNENFTASYSIKEKYSNDYNFKKINTFRLIDFEDTSVSSILVNTAKRVVEDNMFDKIKTYINVFKDYKSFYSKIISTNIKQNDFYIDLWTILENRKDFQKAVKYEYDYSGSKLFKEIEEDFAQIVAIWDNICLISYKAYYFEQERRVADMYANIQEKLYNVIELETNAAHKLI